MEDTSITMTPEQERIFELVGAIIFPSDKEIVSRLKKVFLSNVLEHGHIDKKGRLVYGDSDTRAGEDRRLLYFLFGDIPFWPESLEEENVCK